MAQGIFIADGPSDLPLAGHLEHLCFAQGRTVTLTPIDPRLSPGPDRTVRGRLQALLDQGARVDIAFVHRDSEKQSPDMRRSEIADAAAAVGLTCVVPVVPVRMTEAWLLLDEAEIRRVAGKPGGRIPLDLPGPAHADRVADPKLTLHKALLAASELSGRRRQQFERDFGRNRRLLMDRLDLTGRVTELSAFRRLVNDISIALRDLPST